MKKTSKGHKTKTSLRTKSEKLLRAKKEDWVSLEAFKKLAIIFVITQTLGLIVATLLLAQGAQQPIFTENINDVANSIYLIFMILAMTAVILIVLRFRRKRNILWYIEALAVFTTTIVVASAFFPTNDYIALAIAILLVAWRYTHRNNLWLRNVVGIIAIVGAGALIGISLGLLPVFVFIIALSIYDLIAVFGTKHMVVIGRAVVKQNFAFTIALPTKHHTFELGNGDLVIPLMTASSVMANGLFNSNYFVASLLLSASFIGLMISIYLVAKKQFAMPALPPQTVLMVCVIIAAIFLGL